MREQFENLTEKFTDRIETTNERVLDLVVDTNRRIVDAAVATAERVAETFPVELPFADRLPTPAENGQRYLDFVERAVAVNREFNQRVVTMIKVDAPAAADTISGLVNEQADTIVDQVTKRVPATKAAAKKAPARKSAAKKAAAKKSTASN